MPYHWYTTANTIDVDEGDRVCVPRCEPVLGTRLVASKCRQLRAEKIPGVNTIFGLRVLGRAASITV